MIRIVEVGPRDGLQNEQNCLKTDIKITFIEKLIQAGLRTIEATSFVSAQWVPQMADHEALVSRLPLQTNVSFPVLVPNRKGLERAVASKVKHIAVFAASSETFSQKNIHRSIQDSLQEYSLVIQTALQLGLRVRGYVSCALGCPYEGEIALSNVLKVAQFLFEAGCEEISLGDTIGIGTPKKARELIKFVSQTIPISKLAVHFHDTYGQALANILVCLEEGITTIDSAVAGLGGCPYALGASGNVATEEVVYMLHGIGLETGVNLDKLVEAGEFICKHLHKQNHSKVAVALLAKRSKK